MFNRTEAFSDEIYMYIAGASWTAYILSFLIAAIHYADLTTKEVRIKLDKLQLAWNLDKM